MCQLRAEGSKDVDGRGVFSSDGKLCVDDVMDVFLALSDEWTPGGAVAPKVVVDFMDLVGEDIMAEGAFVPKMALEALLTAPLSDVFFGELVRGDGNVKIDLEMCWLVATEALAEPEVINGP